MAKLAIKGHPTRSNEVIKLLEMLGGKNNHYVGCVRHTCIYFINDNNNIEVLKLSKADETFVIFTLEQFEEEFHYKVGDKVILDPYLCTILSCWWDESMNEIAYCVKGIDFQKTAYVKDLQPYKEQEPIEEMNKIDVYPIGGGFISVYVTNTDKHEIVADNNYEIVQEKRQVLCY